MKSSWNITPSNPLKAYRRFGAAYFMLALFFNLKMEVACSPERSVDFQRTTRCYIRDDRASQVEYWKFFVGLKILIAVWENVNFWVVTPCSSILRRHLQGRRVKLSLTASWFFLSYSSTPNMEIIRPSKTSVEFTKLHGVAIQKVVLYISLSPSANSNNLHVHNKHFQQRTGKPNPPLLGYGRRNGDATCKYKGFGKEHGRKEGDRWRNEKNTDTEEYG
jgi:hypothetical protein